MPPGRKPNYDRRIASLVAELKAALVAREQSRIESQVARHVEGLVRGLGNVGKGSSVPAVAATSSARKGPGRGNRKPRSAAARAAQSRRMKAYWAARRAKKG